MLKSVETIFAIIFVIIATKINGEAKPDGEAIIEVQQAAVPLETGLFAGSRDTYVVLYVNNRRIGKTSTVDDESNPIWYERFNTGPISVNSKIRFALWDKDYFDPDDFMGTTSFVVKQALDADLNNTKIVSHLTDGFIQYRFTWIPITK